jgi:4-hydroxy-tetrahydrodipicolinate synthase
MGIVHNLVPGMMREIYDAFTSNDVKKAAAINARLLHLYSMMEDEPYPGPVKAGLELLGFSVGVPRRPVVPASDEMRSRLKAEFVKLGLL